MSAFAWLALALFVLQFMFLVASLRACFVSVRAFRS